MASKITWELARSAESQIPTPDPLNQQHRVEPNRLVCLASPVLVIPMHPECDYSFRGAGWPTVGRGCLWKQVDSPRAIPGRCELLWEPDTGNYSTQGEARPGLQLKSTTHSLCDLG